MSAVLIDADRAAALSRDLTATSGATRDVVAPFTGSVLHAIPQSSVADVEAAAARARAAQVAWSAAGHAHRRRVLLRAHDLLLERREELLDAVQTETGKTRGQAFEEVVQAASATRYAALAARRVLRPQRRRGGIPVVMRVRVVFDPKGLIGVITPWNYPLALAVMDVAPALAAGNGVVQKADDQAALSVLAARRAFVDAGVPADLWAVVAGPGDEVGSAVVDAADYVCFTGSTATGIRVAQRAAGRLVGASLELGGKNPLLVLDGADPLEAAADVVTASFSSAGQLCVSTERIYVERGVADAFLTALADRIRGMAIGPSFDYSADVGSLATRAQFERVRAHLDDAVAKGATIVAGGTIRTDLGPFMIEPAALTGVTDDMLCAREETFGAVAAVYVVDSAEEGVARANASEYGLNASVIGPRRRARRIATQLRAGSVNVAEGYRASFGSVDAPMGGLKHSGLGRRNGPEGLLRFTDSRTLAEATGVIRLPRTGADFARLGPLILFALRLLRALRLR